MPRSRRPSSSCRALRVSSATITSASRSTATARGDRSAGLPSDVATTVSVPAPASAVTSWCPRAGCRRTGRRPANRRARSPGTAAASSSGAPRAGARRSRLTPWSDADLLQRRRLVGEQALAEDVQLAIRGGPRRTSPASRAAAPGTRRSRPAGRGARRGRAGTRSPCVRPSMPRRCATGASSDISEAASRRSISTTSVSLTSSAAASRCCRSRSPSAPAARAPPQVEEQPALRLRGADPDDAPVGEDELEDVGADPPGGVGRKLHAAERIVTVAPPGSGRRCLPGSRSSRLRCARRYSCAIFTTRRRFAVMSLRARRSSCVST